VIARKNIIDLGKPYRPRRGQRVRPIDLPLRKSTGIEWSDTWLPYPLELIPDPPTATRRCLDMTGRLAQSAAHECLTKPLEKSLRGQTNSL